MFLTYIVPSELHALTLDQILREALLLSAKEARDAKRIGIAEGEEVELMTPEGSVFVKAHLDEMIREGDVHLYHDWPEANGNDLMSGDYLDPISGFPGYRSLLCKVVPARMSANAKEA